MTEARWTTSKLGSWRSSPSSSLHLHSCCCSKRRRRPTIGRTTTAARLIRSSPIARSPRTTRMRGLLAKKALLVTRAPLATSTRAKNELTRPATVRSKKQRARTTVARRDQTRPSRGRRTPFVRLRVRSRVRSRHLVAVRGVTAHTGRTQAMVRTTMVPTTRITTPVMDRHRRTATVAARDGRVRGVSVMPTTSSRGGKLPTAPITTMATSATGTAAWARRIRLTPGASHHPRHPRHVARFHRVVSNRHHRVVSNRRSRRSRHGHCRPTRCFPSHRSIGRLPVSRSRSCAQPRTPRFCHEQEAAHWVLGLRVSV